MKPGVAPTLIAYGTSRPHSRLEGAVRTDQRASCKVSGLSHSACGRYGNGRRSSSIGLFESDRAELPDSRRREQCCMVLSRSSQYDYRPLSQAGSEEFAAETPSSFEPDLLQTVCACIGDVVRELKPEYRSAIESVDLGNMPVEDFAKSEQISANNASVRLHRARKAVAKHLTTVCGACAEHKCVDCTCRRSQL